MAVTGCATQLTSIRRAFPPKSFASFFVGLNACCLVTPDLGSNLYFSSFLFAARPALRRPPHFLSSRGPARLSSAASFRRKWGGGGDGVACLFALSSSSSFLTFKSSGRWYSIVGRREAERKRSGGGGGIEDERKRGGGLWGGS